MKYYIIISVLLITLVACTNKGVTVPPTLNITSTKWFTTRNGNFGTVMLVLSGNTNTDSVTTENYGDGVISQIKIPLKTDKSFSNDTVPVMFTAFASGVDSFTCSTVVRAVNSSGIIADTLVSSKLHY